MGKPVDQISGQAPLLHLGLCGLDVVLDPMMDYDAPLFVVYRVASPGIPVPRLPHTSRIYNHPVAAQVILEGFLNEQRVSP